MTPGRLAPEPSVLIIILYFAKVLDLEHWVGVIQSELERRVFQRVRPAGPMQAFLRCLGMLSIAFLCL